MNTSAKTRTEIYYSSRLGSAPGGMVFVPGRLVLLGEHLDHQGGSILAMPLTKGVHVAYGVRPDHKVQLHALNARQIDTFDLDAPIRSGRRWADLGRGSFAKLGERGQRLPGMNLVVYGDLPAEVGLASSAAYVTGILLAVLEATGGRVEPAEIAQHVAAIERDWAGVACGPMDPYVALAGKPGEVMHLNCRTMSHESYALPKGSLLEAVPTGIKRRLVDTPYNQRRRELAEALAAVRALRPELESLVDIGPVEWKDIKPEVPVPGRLRAHHVVTEVERVRLAVEALRKSDAATLGMWMQDGQVYLSTSFECSLPEIDTQVAALNRDPGVFGARLQGAGWGGSIAVLRRLGSTPS